MKESYKLVVMWPPLKKSLFPVQRVAESVASRSAAKSLFFHFSFVLYENNCQENIRKNIIKKMEKKFPAGENKLTWPVNWKQHFFKAGLWSIEIDPNRGIVSGNTKKNVSFLSTGWEEIRSPGRKYFFLKSLCHYEYVGEIRLEIGQEMTKL